MELLATNDIVVPGTVEDVKSLDMTVRIIDPEDLPYPGGVGADNSAQFRVPTRKFHSDPPLTVLLLTQPRSLQSCMAQ